MHSMFDEKMTISLGLKTTDIINSEQGELLHIQFVLYHVTSLWCFNSKLTVMCEKTIMLYIFTTASKKHPVIIILFILAILKNENHPHKPVIVDEDGTLESTTYVTNLIVE